MLWRGVLDVKCWWAAQVQWDTVGHTHTHRNTEIIRFYPVWVCFLNVFVHLFLSCFCLLRLSFHSNQWLLCDSRKSDFFFKSDAGVSWMGWWHCRGALPRLCAQSEWGVAEGPGRRWDPSHVVMRWETQEFGYRDMYWYNEWSFQNQSSWIYVM